MSKSRVAVNFAGKKVAQQTKLPPRKRPDGKVMDKLIKAVESFLMYHQDCDSYYDDPEFKKQWNEVDSALAPFRRYADGEGREIR